MISNSMPSVSIICFSAVFAAVNKNQGLPTRTITFEVNPQIVGVEDLEFADWQESVRRDLRVETGLAYLT
jgi:hypothetical protein